jgi:AcrR family transcriptional regulator
MLPEMVDVSKPDQRRRYRSPTRQRQARDTRRRILEAAGALFVRHGYAGTTLEAVAAAADVSPKTVVAAFSSKRGILAELLGPVAFGQRFQQLLGRLQATSDPRLRVGLAAQLACEVYATLGPEFALLRGAGTVAPELADLAQRVETRRRQNVAQLVAYLDERRVLQRGSSRDEATDVVWAVTGYDLYRMLVIECGWTSDRYVAWLTNFLVGRLLEPRPL